VASYAQYEDYHNFIKKNLRQIAEFLARQTTDEFKFKICVDSVPIAEKALAQRAGLGFIGKNHLLINPQLGCKILLGEIITTLKLQSDKPMKNSCAQCDKCLRACPTGALTSDGRFDANKCISYLTIEYKDDIEPGLAEKIGDRLFGCDECICACPYQNTAPSCKNKSFKLYFNRANLDMDEILSLTEDEFNERFADSPIKRLGLERLKRNARICLSNLAKG
jgi:epoxyqueuosine reductase